jgi:starvation-inducible DNA-binding protein
MHRTKNDLPEAVRLQITTYLDVRLADCLDLGTQVKQAHWNVKGPNFHPLHLLFDDIAEDIEDYADLIAERAVQLGGAVRGTARDVAANSGLKEYPHGITDGRAHVDAISNALADFGRTVREGIAHTSDLGDAVTSDMLTEIGRGVDKWLWMVEAHLQD